MAAAKTVERADGRHGGQVVVPDAEHRADQRRADDPEQHRVHRQCADPQPGPAQAARGGAERDAERGRGEVAAEHQADGQVERHQAARVVGGDGHLVGDGERQFGLPGGRG